ncbi:MAG TPA: hypothetical protein VJ577_19175 [Burkholderiaceae bacterium]|nr:hypothetical protein [Burkholderiaceae bacterium]
MKLMYFPVGEDKAGILQGTTTRRLWNVPIRKRKDILHKGKKQKQQRPMPAS